jgi:hypothetical protein
MTNSAKKRPMRRNAIPHTAGRKTPVAGDARHLGEAWQSARESVLPLSYGNRLEPMQQVCEERCGESHNLIVVFPKQYLGWTAPAVLYRC